MFIYKSNKYKNKKTGEVVEAMEKHKGTMNINNFQKYMPTGLFLLEYKLI
jgi:hypothetical protein